MPTIPIEEMRVIVNAHKYNVGQKVTVVRQAHDYYPAKILSLIEATGTGIGVSVRDIINWCKSENLEPQPLYRMERQDKYTRIVAECWIQSIHNMEEIW